ncbi:MAG: hypothetical protein AAF570_04480 [Bacteroidota bacterium]
MRLWIIFAIAGNLIWGCAGESAQPKTPSLPKCEALGQIVGQLDSLETLLYNGGKWSVAQRLLENALTGLEKNVRAGDKNCDYLNHRQYPDHGRFLFVEAHRDRREQDTFPDGMKYIIRLRGIFGEDADISEFLSEELAHVARRNPACFMRYIEENPHQEVMLLYSTRWNLLDADTLIARFGRLPDSESIVEYLEEFKRMENTGI